MHKQDNMYIYSPSDLAAFLSCSHTANLNRLLCDGALSANDKNNDSEMNKILQQKGIEHEENILKQYKEKGLCVAEILDDIDLDKRIELTKEAMDRGDDIIYQAAFFDSGWSGFADFLQKCPTPSSLGDYSYEVIDTKLSKKSKPEYIIQLCAYADFISKIQNKLPEHIHIILGDGNTETFKTDDFFYYYLQAKERLMQFMEQFQQEESLNIVADPCKHCNLCRWQEYCDDKRKKTLHLSFIANITSSQMHKLREAGIMTLMDFIKVDDSKKVKTLNPEIFNRLLAQARLQSDKIINDKNTHEIIDYEQGKGFLRLPEPNEGDLFFDMEGSPLQGIEYLFGIHYGDDEFQPFWAHNETEEKQALKDFMDFIRERLSEYPDAFIYHYNHYEVSALKRLACKHAVCEEQLDNLLRQQKFVDLFKVTRESIRTSQPSYSLKDMEIFYQPSRSENITKASDSITQYERWLDIKDDEILKDIEDYNRADCESTKNLREWLLGQKPDGEEYFTPQNSPVNRIVDRKDWEIEYEEYYERLCPEGEETTDFHKLIAHLLEFHRREDKVAWWNMFDRQEKQHEDLVEDTECLGNMKRENIVSGDSGNSSVLTYRFEPQDYKLKVGSRVTNVLTAKNAGEIVEIDDQAGIIKLKAAGLPEILSIGTGGPIASKPLREAIYGYANKVLNDDADDLAITRLLKRQPPRITGRNSDEAIIKDGDMIIQASEAVSNLNNSHIFMQGPPGTGKTFTSAHIIVDLIKSGKKVGITSNSHKAVHNLLDDIEKVAKEKNVSFKGMKKVSGRNSDSFYKKDKKTSIDNVGNTGDIDLSADLFAGTAWLFSNAHMLDSIGYLFIDEAGQVSLANVVAMSGSTKNIILVGDQMQLGQPIQGTHPGEAGQSVLEFLLQDKETIPENEGIFLNKSYRMRPEICDFISNSFYDGRLKSHEDTKERKLNLENIGLPNEGIVLIDAEHKGRSQKSEEEGEIIKDLYNKLLGQEISKDGNIRAIKEKDILIVAPYNAQVNYLQGLLPGASIGTVDKFQGQEASIVFLSMTTSEAENLPRNLEFLYSKNRLNVAISRAQCLTVVIANPMLFQAPASNIEQMRLINGLCRLKGKVVSGY